MLLDTCHIREYITLVYTCSWREGPGTRFTRITVTVAQSTDGRKGAAACASSEVKRSGYAIARWMLAGIRSRPSLVAGGSNGWENGTLPGKLIPTRFPKPSLNPRMNLYQPSATL